MIVVTAKMNHNHEHKKCWQFICMPGPEMNELIFVYACIYVCMIMMIYSFKIMLNVFWQVNLLSSPHIVSYGKKLI